MRWPVRPASQNRSCTATSATAPDWPGPWLTASRPNWKPSWNERSRRVTDDTRGLLADTIEAFVSYIERDPALYRFLVQPGTDAAVDLSGFLDRISNNVALAIGEQLRASGRDSGGAEVIARGVVSFVYAAGDWWVDRRTMPREQLVNYLTEFLSTGFNGQWGSQS